jgi:hypothetical protein
VLATYAAVAAARKHSSFCLASCCTGQNCNSLCMVLLLLYHLLLLLVLSFYCQACICADGLGRLLVVKTRSTVSCQVNLKRPSNAQVAALPLLVLWLLLLLRLQASACYPCSLHVRCYCWTPATASSAAHDAAGTACLNCT